MNPEEFVSVFKVVVLPFYEKWMYVNATAYTASPHTARRRLCHRQNVPYT